MRSKREGSMVSRSELWDLISSCVESPELCLYDIDMPAGGSGTLRVYLAKKEDHSAGISIDDCASVSKRISANPQFDSLLHQCSLEVSSPGVNRRLRRDEHFEGAVDERVTVAARAEDGAVKKTTGILQEFSEGELKIKIEEEDASPVVVALRAVQKARIEFDF